MEYFVYLIPVIASAIAVIFFTKKLVWWELLLQFVVTTILLFGIKAIFLSNNASDTEYFGGKVTSASYTEAWDEWITETCSRTVTSGSGKNATTTTEYYDCSHRDYHSEYWEMKTDIGNHYISEDKYAELVQLFDNELFVDMHRDYDNNDGDRYTTTWGNKFENIYPVTISHSYKNKTQCVKNVFNYPDVSDEEKEVYGLYDYPEIVDYKQNPILSKNYVPSVENVKFLDKMNAVLGNSKQCRIFLIVWENKSIDIAHYQEGYWKGGNKNEFIINIGIDSLTRKIEWCHNTSWTEEQLPKIVIRDYVTEQKVLNDKTLEDIIRTTGDELERNFVRKQFTEFNYLQVDMTGNQMIWLYVIILILNGGVFAFNIFNEFDADGSNKKRNYGRRRY